MGRYESLRLRGDRSEDAILVESMTIAALGIRRLETRATYLEARYEIGCSHIGQSLSPFSSGSICKLWRSVVEAQSVVEQAAPDDRGLPRNSDAGASLGVAGDGMGQDVEAEGDDARLEVSHKGNSSAAEGPVNIRFVNITEEQ